MLSPSPYTWCCEILMLYACIVVFILRYYCMYSNNSVYETSVNENSRYLQGKCLSELKAHNVYENTRFSQIESGFQDSPV